MHVLARSMGLEPPRPHIQNKLIIFGLNGMFLFATVLVNHAPSPTLYGCRTWSATFDHCLLGSYTFTHKDALMIGILLLIGFAQVQDYIPKIRVVLAM